jgi:hypothetical protein
MATCGNCKYFVINPADPATGACRGGTKAFVIQWESACGKFEPMFGDSSSGYSRGSSDSRWSRYPFLLKFNIVGWGIILFFVLVNYLGSSASPVLGVLGVPIVGFFVWRSLKKSK